MSSYAVSLTPKKFPILFLYFSIIIVIIITINSLLHTGGMVRKEGVSEGKEGSERDKS